MKCNHKLTPMLSFLTSENVVWETIFNWTRTITIRGIYSQQINVIFYTWNKFIQLFNQKLGEISMNLQDQIRKHTNICKYNFQVHHLEM